MALSVQLILPGKYYKIYENVHVPVTGFLCPSRWTDYT